MTDEAQGAAPEAEAKPKRTRSKAEATEAEAKPMTIRMVRDAEQYPVPPHSAEVHVDEVDNWAKHGWTRAAD